MPGPLDYLRNLAGYQTPTLTPEQQAAQDAYATQQQAQDPLWKQYAQAGLQKGTDFLRGFTGMGDEGPAGHTAFNTGALLSAVLPFIGPGENAAKGLYSRVARTAESLPEQIHPNKALSIFKNNASGEEIGYRKLDEFLKGKGNQMVPKQEILGHLEQHPVPQVTVKTLGDFQPIGPVEYDGAGGLVQPGTGTQPKYSNYQLPGGENYQEHLFITPPSNPPPLKTEFKHTILFEPNTPHNGIQNLEPGQMDNGLYMTGQAIGGPEYGQTYANQFEGIPVHTEEVPAPAHLQDPGAQYNDPHWDDPNVVAHSRVQDRRIGEPQFRPYVPEDIAHTGVRVYEDPHSGELRNFTGPEEQGYFNPEREWKFTHPDTGDSLSGYGNTRDEAAQDMTNYLNSSEATSGRGRLIADAPKIRNIENIQSDWHQAGNKYGYGEPPDLKQLAMAQDVAELKAVEKSGQIIESLGYDTSMNNANDVLEELDNYHPGHPDRDELLRLIRERDAAYARYQDAFDSAAKVVPDAPFKSSWLDLPLKHQILDVAGNPDLAGISVTPGEELMRRGEGQSPQTNNQKIPGALKRLLTPFGGGNPETLEIPQTMPVASWSYDLGNHGGAYTMNPTGESNWIASATGIEPDMFGYTYKNNGHADPTKFLDYVNAHRINPSLKLPFFRMTPEMKAQILKKGLPIMALTGLAAQPQQEQ